jgi:multidrug efflux system membrane fusion protein
MDTRRSTSIPSYDSRSYTPTFVVAGLLLTAVAGAACSRPAAQAAPPAAPEVTVAPAMAREVTEWDEFTARLEPVQAVSIRPRVSGVIDAVTFEEGGLVSQGQVLFRIDDRPFQAQVDRLRAELVRAQAVRDRAASEMRRADRLSGENAISHEERERRTSAAAEADAAASAIAATLRAAELDLEFTRVISPIDGRAGRAIVTRGNLVSSGPGDATLLTTVVSLDPIYASFDADEQTFLRYNDLARQGRRANTRESGLPIRMALANDDTFVHEGTLQFLDNQLDRSTGTINGRAVFRNRERQLTPGLFVRLRLPGTASYAGVLVEDRAIGTDLDRRFVMVVGEDRTVEARPVTLGPLVDGLRVVRSGLQAGELVVINGLQRVSPGAAVTPTLTEMGGAS